MIPAASSDLAAFEAWGPLFQRRLVEALERVDGGRAEWKDWTRAEGGGGRMAVLRGGVVEKGAVLWSSVSGASNPLTGAPFRAAGVSVIVHPASPHAATAHMNVRRFEEAAQAWWGGGADLTPLGVRHEEDVEAFHEVLRKAVPAEYEAGKAEADRYFFVPHRGRARGAGGVFYDRVDRPDGLSFVQALAGAFLDAYLPLLARRGRAPATAEERERQLVERGVYAEFNLLYDKGTRFGFQSGGNPEAILASLPPLVRW